MARIAAILSFAVLLLASSFVILSSAHICALLPSQRGGYNISTPGDMSCFVPNGPCGSVPSGLPTASLIGGTGFPVLWQQNLNHYTPGFSGFLDVAWAVGPNPTPDAFTTLATVPDYWPHLQAQQTNMSVVITVPNIECHQCVFRFRYHPNKPSEPIFHQCSDVTIAKGYDPNNFGRLFALAQYGTFDNTYLVEIGLDGKLTKRVQIPFELRLSDTRAAIFSGIAQGSAAIDVKNQYLYFLGYPEADTVVTNNPSSLFITYDVSKGAFLPPVHIPPSTGSQWVTLIPVGNTNEIAFLLELKNASSSSFVYQVRVVTSDGKVSEPRGNFPQDDTFVNFFWADYDATRGKLYVLSGDENSLFALRVRLYTVDVNNGFSVSYTLVDNKKYTVSSVHVDQTTGTIYALTPGLFPQPSYLWSLITIDALSGSVNLVGSIGSNTAGLYSYYYGGGVYGTAMGPSDYILHQFKRTLTGTTELGFIRKSTGQMVMSTTLDTGLNNAIFVRTLTYLPPH